MGLSRTKRKGGEGRSQLLSNQIFSSGSPHPPADERRPLRGLAVTHTVLLSNYHPGHHPWGMATHRAQAALYSKFSVTKIIIHRIERDSSEIQILLRDKKNKIGSHTYFTECSPFGHSLHQPSADPSPTSYFLFPYPNSSIFSTLCLVSEYLPLPMWVGLMWVKLKRTAARSELSMIERTQQKHKIRVRSEWKKRISFPKCVGILGGNLGLHHLG